MPWIISSCFESMGEENCVLYRVRAQSRASGLVRFRMNYACLCTTGLNYSGALVVSQHRTVL